jgi:hypothetical protein
MAIPFLANIQLNGNQLLGLRLEVLAADPSGGDLYEGRLWFNSTTDYVKYYNGTDIITVGVVIASISDLSAPTGDVDWGGFKITNLADPTADQHAATRAYVLARIAALVDTAPGTLDTLNELAAALGDDPNFASTLATSIGALDTRLDALEAAPPLVRRLGFNSAASTSTVCTHNFNTLDVTVSVYEVSTGAMVLADVVLTSVNAVTVTFAVAATASQYRIVVVG